MNISEITKPGVHFITEPIKVKSGDRICAIDSRIVGGAKLTVTRVLEDGVCECDLAGTGITLAGFAPRGFGCTLTPSHSELFINSRPANISRYPKEGEFLHITGFGQEAQNDQWKTGCGALEGGFYYEDERPKAWAKDQTIWMHGYWAWDWSPSSQGVDILDAERGFVKALPPYGFKQYSMGRRFHFFNVREEVTEPGDYCLDFKANKVYFRPFEDTDIKTAEIVLSIMDVPAFEIDGVEDVVIEGFTLEGFRGHGIAVTNSNNITVRNCVIRNMGNHGVMMKDSKYVNVRACHIYHTGDCGVSINCGDRMTLERGECAVDDCHIHHVSCWDRCYTPPISMRGVGAYARRNYIHDCPHTAILFSGNDMIITDNEIFRVVQESADAGAIYTGRDYTFRGNEVCRNFVHHLTSGMGSGGTMAIYNDDCVSGTRMDGNVFYQTHRAIFMGGGVDFECNDNVFVNCQPCIGFQNRGESDHQVWRNMVCNTMRNSFYAVNAGEAPYTDRYPELKKIDEYYKSGDDPHIPPSMHCSGNVFCSEEVWRININPETATADIEDNNIEVEFEELRKYLTPRQIDVIFNKCED